MPFWRSQIEKLGLSASKVQTSAVKKSFNSACKMLSSVKAELSEMKVGSPVLRHSMKSAKQAASTRKTEENDAKKSVEAPKTNLESFSLKRPYS